MTDITAEPATRANKATPKAQATARRQAPASMQATAKPAVDEASLAAARAMGFVSVLMSGIRDVNDFAYLDEHVDQFVKLDTHVARLAYGDENDQPMPISGQDIADVHQMFVTAIATLDAAAPNLPGGTVLIVTALARQALEVVKQIADAFEASAATLEPLKALGEYSGLRPLLARPERTIRVFKETPATAKAVTAADVSEQGPARIKAAFDSVELLLNNAHATDEAHDWSGDSDRLLRIAHQLADEANIRPPVGAEVARVAFDIAALIRAARLVPGDSEGPERKALLDQAAVQLGWLTESSGCCDPGVPRPAAPNAVQLDQTPGTSDEAECIELARQATYEIQKLATTMQLVADQLSTEEDHPITHGLMARIIVLSEITFHAAALHGEGRAESVPLNELQRAFKGAI